MMFYKKFFQLLILCLLSTGCSSTERGKRSCVILLESQDPNYYHAVTLPVSRLSVPTAPTPLFTEKDIGNISVRRCACGCVVAVTLADQGAYEMYRLLPDAVGRKLLLACDGEVIGFSVLDDSTDTRELIFVPEIPDDACCDLFCNGKN